MRKGSSFQGSAMILNRRVCENECEQILEARLFVLFFFNSFQDNTEISIFFTRKKKTKGVPHWAKPSPSRMYIMPFYLQNSCKTACAFIKTITQETSVTTCISCPRLLLLLMLSLNYSFKYPWLRDTTIEVQAECPRNWPKPHHS